MTETKKEQIGTSCCDVNNSCDCSDMMKGFMGSKDGSFDCRAIMQKFSEAEKEKPKKK